MTALPPTMHAGCVVLGAAGVLIRGASGSGKSQLALDLLADAKARGEWARLVADDRVHLVGRNGRLLAHVPEKIAGKLEARGLGVVILPHIRSCVVRLVADLCDLHRMPRIPDENQTEISLCSITVPRISAPAARARELIPLALGALGSRFDEL